MRYVINWVRAYKDVIERACAIVTAIGVVIGAGAVWFSYNALEESKKATNAQTVFNVQRFGFGVAKDLFDDKHFADYIARGPPKNASVEHLSAVRQKFGTMLMAYGIIFFQREHGYLNDREWELYEGDLCRSVSSAGANDYFCARSLDKSKFDEEFKQIITECRSKENTHAKTSQHTCRCCRGTVDTCPNSCALHQQPSPAAP